MDDAFMHTIHEIKWNVELNKNKSEDDPGGLTRYLQTLDDSTNNPFKEEIRRKYNEY